MNTDSPRARSDGLRSSERPVSQQFVYFSETFYTTSYRNRAGERCQVFPDAFVSASRSPVRLRFDLPDHNLWTLFGEWIRTLDPERRAKTMPERALHAKAYGAEHAQRLFCAGSECEGWGACCAQHEYSWGAQRSRGGLKGHPLGISRKTGGNASSDRFR